MDDTGPEPSAPPPAWMGLLFMLVAVLIAALGKPAPGVPPAVVWLACSFFFCVGAAITAQASGHAGIARALLPFAVLAIALVMSWIAFGPGDRHCTSTTILPWLTARSGSDSCRLPFGAAAVLMWVFLAWGLWKTARRGT